MDKEHLDLIIETRDAAIAARTGVESLTEQLGSMDQRLKPVEAHVSFVTAGIKVGMWLGGAVAGIIGAVAAVAKVMYYLK